MRIIFDIGTEIVCQTLVPIVQLKRGSLTMDIVFLSCVRESRVVIDPTPDGGWSARADD